MTERRKNMQTIVEEAGLALVFLAAGVLLAGFLGKILELISSYI